MTRISVIEQYDNKDVIQQIYNLKDDIESIRGDAESLQQITEDVTLAKDRANTALAQSTENKVALKNVYTKTEVDSLVASAERFQVLAVSTLPEVGQSSTLYILTSEEPNGMYTWQDGAYTKVGTLGVEVQVDAELSETSTNAVQNKVIASKVNAIESKHQTDYTNLVGRITSNETKADSAISQAQEAASTAQTAQSTSSDNSSRIEALEGSIAGKQDKLTAGTNITISDDNIISCSVTGGGTVAIDGFLSTTSENPVQNKVIASSINSLTETVESYEPRLYEVETNVTVALEYGTDIGNLQNDVNGLDTRVKANATNITNLNSRMDSAEDDISSLSSSKQNKVTGAATTIVSNNLQSNRVLVSSSSGKVTTTQITPDELVMLSGSTENIQDAIDEIRTQLGTSYDYDVGYIGNTSSSASTITLPYNVTFYQRFEGIPAVFVSGGWNNTEWKSHPLSVYDLSASGMKIGSNSDWKYIAYLAIYPRSR